MASNLNASHKYINVSSDVRLPHLHLRKGCPCKDSDEMVAISRVTEQSSYIDTAWLPTSSASRSLVALHVSSDLNSSFFVLLTISDSPLANRAPELLLLLLLKNRNGPPQHSLL